MTAFASAPPRAAPPGVIRVASVPAAHPYVAGLGDAGVVRLSDGTPPGAAPGQWWPPVMLDAAWVRDNASRFELMHVHFGAESYPVRHVADTLQALQSTGRPLVYTVHDLVNPQLDDQRRHLAQLDLLIPGADALVTLTRGAADEIRERWGRRAEVIEHPRMLPVGAPAPSGRPRGRQRVVGLHLRDLRPSVDGPGATDTLVEAVTLLRQQGEDVIARVHLHDDVRDEDARLAVRRRCAGSPSAVLLEGLRPADAELAAELADLDVAVLPYRHGTHSGWVELCWDLAVPVAAPPIGHVADQHDDPGFLTTFAAGDPASLAVALAAGLSLAARPGTAVRTALQRRRRQARDLQDHRIATAHLAVYRRALGAADRSA